MTAPRTTRKRCRTDPPASRGEAQETDRLCTKCRFSYRGGVYCPRCGYETLNMTLNDTPQPAAREQQGASQEADERAFEKWHAPINGLHGLTCVRTCKDAYRRGQAEGVIEERVRNVNAHDTTVSELYAERADLRAENARLREIFDAACEWYDDAPFTGLNSDQDLRAALDLHRAALTGGTDK